MKNIIKYSIFIFIIKTSSLYAQSTAVEMAFASEHGIFVKLEEDYPENIKQGNISYEIGRRADGESNFKTVAIVKVPQTFQEFADQLKKAADANPEPLLMRDIPSEMLWRKFSSGGYDSIVPYRNAIFLQLALGVKYFDAGAEKNKHYEYQVTKKTDGKSFITNKVSFPSKPVDYNGRLYSSKETAIGISMQYDCKGLAPDQIRVYREENYSGTFMPVRAKRIKTISKDTTSFYIYDTLVTPNVVYRYYVLPLDYYGNYGNVNDTITTIASSKQYAGNIEHINVQSYFNEGTAIRWKLSDPVNFNYLAIYRAENFDSAMVKIGMASAIDTQYIDASAEPMRIYFYALQPVTRAGAVLPISAKSTGMYTPVIQIPAPYITSIEATGNGIQLTVKSNDPQTRGFRIYRRAKNDSAFILISGLVKNEKEMALFLDTLSLNPGKDYAYIARAENKAYTLSTASNIVWGRVEGKLELSAPGVPHVEIINSIAFIQWKSNGIKSSISSYSVYSKSSEGAETVLKENIPAGILNYTDLKYNPAIETSYGISYRDNSGNNSAIAFAKPVGANNNFAGPVNVYAVANEKAITISWTAENKGNIASYKIYRLTGDKPLLISEVGGENETYTINNIEQGEAYSIYITAINKDNIESLPGKTITAFMK